MFPLLLLFIRADETATKYGLNFDLSGVSADIKITYTRSDDEAAGKITAEHKKDLIIEGDAQFSITVYVTYENCNDEEIDTFDAASKADGEYQVNTITDASFASCKGGGGDVPATKYGLNFDLSGVSADIKITYTRSDDEAAGKITAEHKKDLIIEGDAQFSITVYVTYENCNDEEIDTFDAASKADGEYQVNTITDKQFESCKDENKCEPNKNHCQECNEANTKCTKCTNGDNLKTQGIRCVCADNYVFVNDVCVEVIKPLYPTPTPDPTPLPEGSSTLDKNNIQTITTEKLETPDNSKIYLESLLGSATQLAIINKNNADLHVKIDKDVPIVPQDDNTKVTLEVESDKFQLKNAASVTINAKKSDLNINGFEDNAEITIGKIISSDPNIYHLNLKTNKKLIIKELQIFGEKSIDADKDSVKIEKIKVEQGGRLNPSTNLQIQSIEIGVESELVLNDVIKESEITIYYNRPQADDENYKKYPLEFEKGPAPIVPKSLTIKQKDLGQVLEEKDYVLLRDVYPQKMENEIKKVCDEWEKDGLYKSDDSPFKRITCQFEYYGEKEEVKYNKLFLVATNSNKPKKKNGLSAGAIAGIVIACVVVVAGVAVLVWYFAFYKRKVGVSADEAEP